MANDADIFEHLRHRLVNGQFEPGARLQAEKLRADYGCSASLIRECLFRLSCDGLVDFLEQRGFRVPQVSEQVHHELTHLRILLESEGAVLSARLGDVAWEAQLSAAHHKLSHIETRLRARSSAPGLLDLWSAAELEFHHTLIGACGSQNLIATHQQIFYRFRQMLIMLDKQFISVAENIAEHKAIVDAALDRDETRLRARIHAHLSRHLTTLDAVPA